MSLVPSMLFRLLPPKYPISPVFTALGTAGGEGGPSSRIYPVALLHALFLVFGSEQVGNSQGLFSALCLGLTLSRVLGTLQCQRLNPASYMQRLCSSLLAALGPPPPILNIPHTTPINQGYFRALMGPPWDPPPPAHITCFSSNRTFRVSSMRFRFTSLIATRLPWTKGQ